MSPHRKQHKKILLMYITKVSGHRQATLAIQKSLKEIDPDVNAPTVNGFGYTYPLLEKVVNGAYMSVIKRTPKVWDYMYDNPKIVKKSQSIKNFLHRTSHDKLDKLFVRHRPHAVVCTQAFPCGMVASYKKKHNLNTLLVGVLTDFSPHSFWINEGVDYYIVPSLEAKERFITKGVDPDSIKVYGIPIQSKFSIQLDREPIANRLGLDANIPTILIMGGGQGLGPIKKVMQSLMKIEMPFQMIVLAGVNKKIVHGLRQQTQKSDKKIFILEYTKDVDELMELSTLIITKPGGMTTAESLTKGLPMVIIDPIPGQEMRNTDFLINKDIGIRVDSASDVGEEVELLLKSSRKIADMSKAAYEHGKPHAALDIARLILDRTG